MSTTSSNDSSVCSFENVVPSDESLCLDEIMRLKEKRLKLLHEYKSEEEDDDLKQEQLMRKKAKTVPKPKKKPDTTVKLPSRRSERIKSQAVNESKPPEPSTSEPVKRERPVGKVRPMIRVRPVVRERSIPQERPVPRERASPRERQPARERTPHAETSWTRHESICGETSWTPRETHLYGETSWTREMPLFGETSLAKPRLAHGETRRARQMTLYGETSTAREMPLFGETSFSRERRRSSSGERPTVKVKPAASLKLIQKPGNIYGPIPDIEVGHQWNSRMECSQDGVHRPTIAGIHPGPMGAYSVALSGGYPEDIDEGHTVIFTGAGGRDLRGVTGRTKSVTHAPQVKDQVLNSSNWSLIRSCETGVPVRVIRGHKLAGEYAPEIGYRYDGLYRVVQYCYTYGYSGYRIYRFRLCRMEGQGPPPWEITPRMVPVTSKRPKRRKPQSITGGELDREIEICIQRMSRDSHFYDDDGGNDNDGWPLATFSGWSMS